MKTKKVVRMPLRRPAQRTRPGNSVMNARAATADEAYDDEEDYGGEDEPNMKFSHAVVVVLALHIIAVGGIFAFNSIKASKASEAKATSQTAAAATSSANTAGETAPAATATGAAAKPEATAGKTYTIQPGDTLTRIAALNNVKVADLEKENEITSSSTLRVGQVLNIPTAAGKTETKTAPVAPAAAPKTVAAIAPKTAPTTATAPKVLVPAPAAATEKPAAKTVEAKAVETDLPGAHGTVTGDTYVVVKGDNPYSIAKKLHVSYNDLLSANDIKDATKIQIGQKLKIPKK